MTTAFAKLLPFSYSSSIQISDQLFKPMHEDPINPESQFSDEDVIDRSLRPEYLEDFVGQAKLKEQLSIFIEAAKSRSESLDHVLLFNTLYKSCS